MAILIPSRSTRLTQPIGRAEVDPGYGITPIGLFLPASFTEDAATGEVFTRGSAATLTTSRVGPALNQTAVNTGLHRTIPGLQSVSDYTAIWHGVPIGAPSGSTPSFVGIANSNTSQGAGPLVIEYLSTTQLQVVFKSGTTGSTRAGNFTWANTYGKPTTLVASYSADEDFVRLRVCVDGVVTDVVASAVTSSAPPTLLGTERLIVGPDVVEIPTRHTNAHVALAGVFYGRLRGDAVQDVLRNPWRLFRPVERRIVVALAASGGPTYVNATRSSTFSVRGFASASQASAWSVRAHVGASGASAWSVRNHAAQTAAASYTVRNFASASASAAFSVQAAGLVSAAASAAFSVRNHTEASRSAAASVRNFTSASASAAFSVQASGLVTASRSAAWTVRNAVATSAGAAFTVRNHASALQACAWSVRSAVVAARSAAWSVKAYVYHTAGAAWSVDGDDTGPIIDWSVTGARAIVPPASTRAIVPHFDAVAIVPAANTRAIVPASGDDMDPIKTVEQYRQDREVYEIDFGAKYLTQANDTAATLKAVGSDAGITVTPQVAVGGALSSGVVKLAVDDPTAVGEYKVWAQIATTAGRERTGEIVVRVEDL